MYFAILKFQSPTDGDVRPHSTLSGLVLASRVVVLSIRTSTLVSGFVWWNWDRWLVPQKAEWIFRSLDETMLMCGSGLLSLTWPSNGYWLHKSTAVAIAFPNKVSTWNSLQWSVSYSQFSAWHWRLTSSTWDESAPIAKYMTGSKARSDVMSLNRILLGANSSQQDGSLSWKLAFIDFEQRWLLVLRSSMDFDFCMRTRPSLFFAPSDSLYSDHWISSQQPTSRLFGVVHQLSNMSYSIRIHTVNVALFARWQRIWWKSVSDFKTSTLLLI